MLYVGWLKGAKVVDTLFKYYKLKIYFDLKGFVVHT